MVPQHGPFSLHTMLEGPWLHKTAFQHPWYGLWTRVKGPPHHYKVAALGSCVKWPWEPVTITLQTLLLVEKAEPVQVLFKLRLRDQRSMWMQDGCKSLHGFLQGIKWIMFHGHSNYFKNHLLEVGLTQIQETTALRMLTTVDLFYSIMCEDPHE
jgi:hypothetical protein